MATKVTVHDSAASAEKPTAAAVPVVVTDAKGRSLKVQKIGPLARMRLFKAIGGENASNQMYLGYATVAASVIEIDGDPVSPPVTELQLEALVQRLGDEGLDAAGNAIVEHFAGLTAEQIAALAKN